MTDGDDTFRSVLSLVTPDTVFAFEFGGDGTVTAVELWAVDGAWARSEGGTVIAKAERVWLDAPSHPVPRAQS